MEDERFDFLEDGDEMAQTVSGDGQQQQGESEQVETPTGTTVAEVPGVGEQPLDSQTGQEATAGAAAPTATPETVETPAQEAVGHPETAGADSQRELDMIRAQLEEYKNLVTMLQGGQPETGQTTSGVPSQQPAPGDKPATQTPAPTGIEPIVFVEDEAELDEALKTHENMNAFLNKAFGKFITTFAPAFVQSAVEKSMTEIPNVTRDVVRNQIGMHSAVQEFWGKNSDLRPHKEYAGMVSNRIAITHPEYDVTKILEETEKEVREKLKIPRIGDQSGGVIATSTQPGPGQPAFVRSGPARTSAPTVRVTPLEKEILDLIN